MPNNTCPECQGRGFVIDIMMDAAEPCSRCHDTSSHVQPNSQKEHDHILFAIAVLEKLKGESAGVLTEEWSDTWEPAVLVEDIDQAIQDLREKVK